MVIYYNIWGMETRRRSSETYIHLELRYCQQLNTHKALTLSGKEGAEVWVQSLIWLGNNVGRWPALARHHFSSATSGLALPKHNCFHQRGIDLSGFQMSSLLRSESKEISFWQQLLNIYKFLESSRLALSKKTKGKVTQLTCFFFPGSQISSCKK